MHIIAQAYLRCCGVAKTNGSHTGYYLRLNLVIVVINTSFADTK